MTLKGARWTWKFRLSLERLVCSEQLSGLRDTENEQKEVKCGSLCVFLPLLTRIKRALAALRAPQKRFCLRSTRRTKWEAMGFLHSQRGWHSQRQGRLRSGSGDNFKGRICPPPSEVSCIHSISQRTASKEIHAACYCSDSNRIPSFPLSLALWAVFPFLLLCLVDFRRFFPSSSRSVSWKAFIWQANVFPLVPILIRVWWNGFGVKTEKSLSKLLELLMELLCAIPLQRERN